MTRIDARSGYHNLKYNKMFMPNHFSTFILQIQICHTTIWTGAAGYMFQPKKEINKIFKDMPNVFDIADNLLLLGYDVDGRDHDRILSQPMQICH